MKRYFGTVARGLRSPIINEGDDLLKIIPGLLEAAVASGQLEYHDRDILAVTESILGRSQGNYASIYDIRDDIQKKFGPIDRLGLVFPILSRNRFSILLKAISLAVPEVVLLLSYPTDEVGNALFNPDLTYQHGNINPWQDVLTVEELHKEFGATHHPFTGIDYLELYQNIVEEAGAKCQIVLANNAEEILNYTPNVLVCDIHNRANTRRRIEEAGVEKVFSLTEILSEPSDKHGYNPDYGLLGSNKADEERVKLFPRDCQDFVYRLAEILCRQSGKQIEVMVYGDGAFKDPVGKIWELADPVVSPGFTTGLKGKPNEVKIKYLADSTYNNLASTEQTAKIIDVIKHKHEDLVGKEESEGTTPRQYTDLLGSLSDLVSGSGDKGTPFVYIQGYFDSYADE
ncbi:MAG: coenzyme F420-0:L-glutamate ligase [Eubacteriales bacterium]|nr:coenzyme F420-0:L-glutamate ligase [Eubacteriales bacterium]